MFRWLCTEMSFRGKLFTLILWVHSRTCTLLLLHVKRSWVSTSTFARVILQTSICTLTSVKNVCTFAKSSQWTRAELTNLSGSCQLEVKCCQVLRKAKSVFLGWQQHNFRQRAGRAFSVQKHRTKLRKRNWTALMKYKSRLCYCIAFFHSLTSSETYLNVM